MKQFIISVAILFYLLLTIRCDKKSIGDSQILNDSIPLKFVDLKPDTNWIDLDNDKVMDIKIQDTTILFYQGEPQDVYISETLVRSYNENVLVSYGKLLQNGDAYLLDRDSIINNSLTWVNNFVTWGPHNYVPIQYNPNYIGLKITKNNHTYFGWIYKSQYFTEYAIDTVNSIDNRMVSAGKRKK